MTTHALLLSGGRATRLRPLSDEVPKALMPLGPTCVFELQLLWLRQYGFTQITVAAGPATEAIAARFGTGTELAVTLNYLPEPEPLGSGGVLRSAAAGWREPFWVINGDVLISLDLSAMAKRHAENRATASIALVAVEDVRGFGVVKLGAGDEILRFIEKPEPENAPSNLINAGVWRFDPEAVGLLPPTDFASVESDLFPAIRKRGQRLQGFPIEGYWCDMGTPERYLRVAADLVAGRLPTVGRWPAINAGRFIGEGTRIGTGATVAASLVGPRCDVAAGAMIERSVLWEEVTIESTVSVTDSIVGRGARIAAGVRVDGAVVGQRAEVMRDLTPGDQVPTDGHT